MRVLTEKIQAAGHEAELILYLQDNSAEIDPLRQRPMILICPGGGYEFLSEREGEPVALHFLSLGYQAAVLKYSVAPAVRYPVALKQLATSVAFIRKNAGDFFVDAAKITVLGFSAGGHLAASLGVNWNKPLLADIAPAAEIYPNALVLSYPVISSGKYAHQGSFQALLGADYPKENAAVSIEKLVDQDFPATFVWHTVADDAVPAKNSLLLADALYDASIPFEFHLYNRGLHGLSLGTVETRRASEPYQILEDVENWPQMADRWLKNQFAKN
ncbi:alpha/beta hydrolase [Enterococcus sp. HY326]|uniref:alpha/beta hydrolase n=1 Tax=Enterococcus sp. HY326 TaxID=2971265 RepID=UPI00223F375A|nr:alpha/beta hydrolase [Enterococcus sp. HY326]